MPNSRGLPSWFPEDFAVNPALIDALADSGREIQAAGTISGQVIDLRFDPAQPRDRDGRWTRGGAGTLEKVTSPIGMEGARGNSRAVSHEEFQRIAAEGRDRLRAIQRAPWGTRGLDRNWEQVKRRTYAEVQKSWGGATIDPRTGDQLPQGADKYAMSIKPSGLDTTMLPEHAGLPEFSQAMDIAKDKYGRQLAKGGSYLGIFHDDDLHRIDIDPVTVLDTLREVETIGAYTHAIGGAYHFRSGDGFWPPHVAEGASMANEDTHWDGPGQWHSHATSVQDGFDDEQDGTITGQLDLAGAGGILGQLIDLAAQAWRHERRGPDGKWASSGSGPLVRSASRTPDNSAIFARSISRQVARNRMSSTQQVAEKVAEERARKALDEARSEVEKVTRQLRQESKSEERAKHRAKLAIHAVLIIGGAILAAVMAHFDVSPVMASFAGALPLIATELTDWRKKL